MATQKNITHYTRKGSCCWIFLDRHKVCMFGFPALTLCNWCASCRWTVAPLPPQGLFTKGRERASLPACFQPLWYHWTERPARTPYRNETLDDAPIVLNKVVDCFYFVSWLFNLKFYACFVFVISVDVLVPNKMRGRVHWGWGRTVWLHSAGGNQTWSYVCNDKVDMTMTEGLSECRQLQPEHFTSPFIMFWFGSRFIHDFIHIFKLPQHSKNDFIRA